MRTSSTRLVRLVFCAIIFGTPAGGAGPSAGLLPAVSYSTGAGTFPVSAALGDFNGDGKPDLAVAGSSADTISVFLGKGDGTFSTAAVYQGYVCGGPPCGYVNSVIAGDFNGDGKADLVVAAIFPLGLGGGVSFFQGNGDGTFKPPVHFVANPFPESLIAADFNGDGKADLAGADGGSGVTVMLGNGNGSFQPAVSYHTSQGGVPNSVSQAVGDFNGDGRTDLVVVNRSDGTVSVLLGNGDGTFQPAVAWAVNSLSYSNPVSVAVGDFDGDGSLDLAVAGGVNVTSGENRFGGFLAAVSLLLGNGDGTFRTPVSYLLNEDVNAVAAGDLNGDGKLDLVVSGTGGTGLVAVLLGNGDGSFRAPVYYPVVGGSRGLVLGDFNGDGKTDVVNVNFNPWIDVLLGGALPGLSIAQTHVGSFTAGVAGAAYTLTVSNQGSGGVWGTVRVVDELPTGFTATMIAGDGWSCDLSTVSCIRSDSLAAGATYSPITVQVNLGSDLYGDAINSATVLTDGGANVASNSAAYTQFVRLATATTLSVAPNPSVIGQAVTLTAAVSPDVTGRVTFTLNGAVVGVAPINGSQATLTTAQLRPGSLSLRAQYAGDSKYGPSDSTRSLIVAAGATNGFQSAAGYGLNGSENPQQIVVGDFNRDGIADLATANLQTNDVSVLLGNGDGTFQPAVSYAAQSQVYQVQAGDFNGDGRLDLAVLGESGVSVLLGNGDGTFQTALPFQTPGLPCSKLAIADFNVDGNPDLVCFANFGAAVLLGNGDGTFQKPLNLGVNYAGFGAVGDLNGDGIPDLVIVGGAGGAGGGVSVLLGEGDGTFRPGTQYRGGSVISFLIDDFDGDGIPDVVGFSAYPEGIEFWSGNGDGTLRPPMLTSLSALTFAPLAGDFNGDGILDIAAPNFGTLKVFLGNGDGTFQGGPIISVPGTNSTVAQGDFNGDGKADFAVARTGDSTILVVLGKFSGLAIQVTHAGNFTAGQSGAAYQIAIKNPSAIDNSGTVTVTDTLSTGLTATAMSGTGWTCVVSTLTCTRPDTLAARSSYPAITLTVDVSGGVGAPSLINRASILSGGVTNSAVDETGVAALYVSALANAASLATGVVAPNTIVSAYGSFPGCADGARVLVDGGAADVLYSSAGQINFVIPASVAAGSSPALLISCAGLSSRPIGLTIAPAAPAIFTISQNGAGQAAMINADGSIASPSRLGTEIAIYGTGFGVFAPTGSDGLTRLASPVTATIGSVSATVTYAGAAPGYTSGLQQINVQIPTILEAGALQESLKLSINYVDTQTGVNLAVIR